MVTVVPGLEDGFRQRLPRHDCRSQDATRLRLYLCSPLPDPRTPPLPPQSLEFIHTFYQMEPNVRSSQNTASVCSFEVPRGLYTDP